MNDTVALPLVTLGMPVFNERAFIAETLENLQQQTYPNLEILIADNGSTDGTEAVCREFSARDPRIRYVRHGTNLGQPANFNYLAQHASGPYFCWVSGHDVLDQTFVADCVRVLESDPRVVLAYPRTMNMTEDGTFTGEKTRPFDIRTMSAQRRFREVMWRVDCNYVYGMYRLKPMLRTHLFQLVPAGDRVFLSEMAIQGTFAPVDTFKYYRLSRGTVPQTELQKRHRLMSYIFPDRVFSDEQLDGNAFYLPTQRAFRGVVRDAGFPVPVRFMLYASIWLSGVMKSHLFPGADVMSVIVKKILPKKALDALMRTMR